MIRTPRLRLVTLLAFLGVLIPVSAGTCVPDQTPDDDSGAGDPVRDVIDSAGGILETTNLRGDRIALEVPAGAVSQPLTISMKALGATPGNPIGTNFFPGVELLPKGLRFLKPAILRVTLAAGPADARGLLFYLQRADFVIPVAGQQAVGNVVSGEIRHFSTYLGGAPSDSEAATQAGMAGGQTGGSSQWQITLDHVGGMLEWAEWFETRGMNDQGQAARDQAEQALRQAIECFLDPDCHLVPIDVCSEEYVREALGLHAHATSLGLDSDSQLMQDLGAAVTHLLNQCTNRFEVQYDYMQKVGYGEFQQQIRVTGKVPFSLPVYGVSDVENLQATGQGTVSGTISGVAGECSISGNFTVDVTVTGELQADDAGLPWLALQLHEKWYSSGRQTITCDDGSSNVPLPPIQSVQNVRLLMQDGYVFEQPHAVTEGYYRWTLRVLHLW